MVILLYLHNNLARGSIFEGNKVNVYVYSSHLDKICLPKKIVAISHGQLWSHVSWRTEPLDLKIQKFRMWSKRTGDKQIGVSTKNTVFSVGEKRWKSSSIFTTSKPQGPNPNQSQNPGRLEDFRGGGGVCYVSFRRRYINLIKFVFPGLILPIHEFLTLTYLGSTHPRRMQAYQTHGFFWLEFQKPKNQWTVTGCHGNPRFLHF